MNSKTTNNKSKITIVDNIRILQKKMNLNNYKDLSDYSGIPLSTIKTWYSSDKSCPKIDNLDKLADSFFVKTSDLFVPNNFSMKKYIGKNNSRYWFKYNFKKICLDKQLFSRYDIFLAFEKKVKIYTIDSYLKDNANIIPPINVLDFIASRLDVETYKLIEPSEE